MECVKTIFVFEIVSCFLDVSVKSLKFISIVHPRSLHYFGQITFCPVLISVTSRPRANIGEGKKKKAHVKGERRNQRHKSSEIVQEK